MKEVRLAYGRRGLLAHVPDDAAVITPQPLPGLPDERAAVVRSLRSTVAGPPLGEVIADAGERTRGLAHVKVAVVFPDLTRPMPNRTVLPPILDELVHLGVGTSQIELLCATGTHRSATAEEMEELVGPDITSRFAIHQHRAEDADHVRVGTVDGTPVLLDRRYVEADVRILTGFVEPHFFAGFSGGPKGACPGLAGLETILEAHSPARIGDERATWLVTEGNPVHDFVRAAVAFAPPSMTVDVAINASAEVTAVFAGRLPDAHVAACRFVERTAVQRVDRPYDVVVSTNGGYPLDRNLYQAVKGMAAVERIVRAGGTIVMAASCADGTPAGSASAQVLADAGSAEALDRREVPGRTDAWQAQVLGRVLRRARVWLRSDGLTDDEVRGAYLRPIDDLDAAVAQALHGTGRGARVGVLPFGPLTVASVAREP